MKFEVIQHIDDYFSENPESGYDKFMAERVELIEIDVPEAKNVFLVSILRTSEDGLGDKEYMAFDSLNEANDWLDLLGYDILR